MAEPAVAVARAAVPRPALSEPPAPGQVNLRGDPSDGRFMTRAGAVLGCVLPTAPDGVRTAEAVTVLWLGPDEWLALTEPGAEGGVAAALEAALDGLHASVVDVTGARVRFRLAGPVARDVLAKGCPLDLHPRAFPPGRCAQSLLARTGVLIHLVDAAPTFDLYPRRSFAPYLRAWLEDAMREFGPA